MRIQSKRVWLDKKLQPAILEICNSKVTNILPFGSIEVDIDYKDSMILPGFIDIHDHGYLGGDANHATMEFLQEWAMYLTSEGITSFLPTTSTAFEKDLYASYKILGEAIESKISGANLIGLHIEGPMISCDYRGSHNPKLIVKPDIDLIKKWNDQSKGHIKMITLAPENDEGLKTTAYCVEHGITVSIGHSAATYEQSKEAVMHGVESFTHTFNGMKGLHHREPGTVGAAMNLDNAYAEIIADGVHVDFNVVNILGKIKGENRLITVSDSIWAKGMPQGIYPKPEKGVDIIIDEHNTVRLSTGSLAGSTNRLNKMVYNLINEAKLPFITAIQSVTSNPAHLLKLDHYKGYLKEGYDADITVVDDDINIIATFVGGIKYFSKKD